MKIEQSNVVTHAAHQFSCTRDISVETECNFQQVFGNVSDAMDADGDNASREARLLMMLKHLIDTMLAAISGERQTRIADWRELLPVDTTGTDNPARPGRGVLSFELKTRTCEMLREQESLCFSAAGTARTADGRSLDFRLKLDLDREFVQSTERITESTVELRDPLVINFAGKACELSGKRFAFDLDVDGKNEAVPALAASSGFLAIDHNGDGVISDGSELFGTRSGDGFAELAAFDQDHNGWIDESDAVFDALRVWRYDGQDVNTLEALREEGIGALYLGSAAGDFRLTDEENQLLAQIRASGIYLEERGGVGSMQQVDLAI